MVPYGELNLNKESGYDERLLSSRDIHFQNFKDLNNK